MREQINATAYLILSPFGSIHVFRKTADSSGN